MSATAKWRALLAAILMACFVLPSTAAASARHDRMEAGIIRAMNQFRAGYGLPALRPSAGFARAADAHSRAMLRSNTLSHGAFSSRVRHYVHVRSVGENLAWMDHCSPAAIVQMWINSPGHRSVMLERTFRRVGVGHRSASNVCFVTADFGSAT